MSDKTGWEGRDQSRGTQVGAHGALSRALGPAKENNYALESLDGYIVWGYWELKWKFRPSTATGFGCQRATTRIGGGVSVFLLWAPPFIETEKLIVESDIKLCLDRLGAPLVADETCERDTLTNETR
jgi:hypothetical protein